MDMAHLRQTIAFQWGAGVLLVAASVIVAALGFEYIGGYLPCPLCLQQRYAYYTGVPLTGLALVLLGAGKRRVAVLLFFAVALSFLANVGLATYQAGAEWGLWPGPQSCEMAQPLSSNAASLLKDLSNMQIIRCDEASWRFLGLSFAGWNVVMSGLLSLAALRSALACESREHLKDR
jgi:disulfide bond formation protein DsbB